MSCLNPILAVSIMKNSEDKHVLRFISPSDIDKLDDLKRVYGIDEVFLLPCMKCKSCRQDYASDWALRATLEAKMHKYNYFITCTYDDYHILKANKKDFSDKFLKELCYRLTGKRNRPLFFACQERGELTNRLHFHGILFLDSPLVLKKPVKLGSFYHYSCDLLDSCWRNGFVDVTPFEHDCAAYVAKYSTKQGSCFMSRNLAKSYYLEHREEIINDNFKVYGSFGNKEVSDIPKCFVRWFLEDQVSGIEEFKLNRKKLQSLLVSQQVRSLNIGKEQDLVRSKILAFLENQRFKKGRVL